MGQQSVRQAARRGVMEALAARRRERAEQEKRLEDLGVQVAAALMERDEAVAGAEGRAGEALRTMTKEEGLSVREALAWCGEPVSVREAARLVKAAAPTGTTDDEPPAGRRRPRRTRRARR